MKQTTFIADGKTKIFHFTFPFFLKSDVIIEVDSRPATNCNLICMKNGLNADVPFIGGELHFKKPPKAASVITVRRNLSLTRVVDYQPTAPYNPTAHNQDMNYIIEILKDMKDAVESVLPLPTDAANQAAIDVIRRQIEQIISTLDELNTRVNQFDEIGDLSEIHNSIENLSNYVDTLNRTVGTNSSSINRFSNFKNEVHDYVVESQRPSAENNYTWYRKYKSGWVEQGGQQKTNSGEPTPVTLPITMASDKYIPITQGRTGSDGYDGAQWQIMPVNTAKSMQTASKFYAQGSITGYDLAFTWQVTGLAAE